MKFSISCFKKFVTATVAASLMITLAQPAVLAAGSSELNQKETECRFYSEAFTEGTTAGVDRKTSIMCYLQEGERVYFGSSVYNSQLDINYQNQGTQTGNDISVKTPGNVITSYDVIENGAGHIQNPTQEANGPRLSSSTNTDYYEPLTFQASETGIYTFSFYSKTGYRESPEEKQTINQWNEKRGTVAAWNITVTNSIGTVIPGRTWANYLSIITGSATQKSSLHTYVLTDDGVIYKVDLNEVVPNGFIFFSNNQGFTDRGIAPKSIYHSFYDTDTSAAMSGMEAENISVHLPNAADSSAAKTFKIFFEKPDPTLLAAIAPTPSQPDPINNLTFHGLSDNITREGLGGEFRFITNNASSATLTIDFNDAIRANGIDFNGSGIAELTGAVTDGPNVFYWNGRDTTNTVIPAGEYSVDKIKISAEPKQGEIHFPLLDVEGMYGGLTIQRMNGGNLISEPDDPKCNAFDLYYNNNPLAFGTIEGKDTAAVSSGNYLLLSDGTKQKKLTQSKYFHTENLSTISTLTSNGHVPVNSSVTSMQYDSSGNEGGGNAAGIDIWTYFTATDSTKTSPMSSITEKTTLTILAPPTDTGSITGLVFYDANSNHTYNLEDQDSILAGVTVQLYASSDLGNIFQKTETLSDDENITVTYETTTDINGVYHFNGLPAGQYVIKTLPGSGRESYKNNTGNDGSSPESCKIITVTAGKETRNENIGYEVPFDSPVSYTFHKKWGLSNPLSSVLVKLYTQDSNGKNTFHESAELKDSNNWTHTFPNLDRNLKYYAEEYYYNGNKEVLVGRSPVFCANDSYWGNSVIYQRDTSSASEKKVNAASDAKVYNLRFGMSTADRCNYIIDLYNQQTYDQKEYYVRLGEQRSLDDFLSVTGKRTNTVESIDPAKLTIKQTSGTGNYDYTPDPDNHHNLLYTASTGTVGTRTYDVTYNGVKFVLTIHVYDAAEDTYPLNGQEIIDGIAGTPVILQSAVDPSIQWYQGNGTSDPRTSNLLLKNDTYRLSEGSAGNSSAQIAGIAYAGNSTVSDPASLTYLSPVTVDNTGTHVGSINTVSAGGQRGTLTLLQKKTDAFLSGPYDMADYAEISYLPGSSRPYNNTEVYYYKLIIRSPLAKGIGLGTNGEDLKASQGIVLYTPVIITYDFPYTVTYQANGHGSAPAPVMVARGNCIEEPAAPVAEGYTFGGWYENSDCTGSPFDFQSVLSGSKTLYAKWTLNSYTVQFDANGGVPSVESRTVSHGNPVAAPSVSYAGYTLVGWFNTDDNSKWDFDSTPVTADVSLKARWEPNSGTEYKIEHYTQELDGSYSLAKTTNHTGITAENVSYTSEYFDGFSLDLNVPGTISSGIIAGDGSLILKLYYTRNSYTISYEYTNSIPGAPEISPQAVKFGATVNLVNNPELTGYTFDSWTTDDATVTDGSLCMPSKNVVMKGKWNVNQYTITWKYDDGSVWDTETYFYGTTPSHASPSKASTQEFSYSFNGWSPSISEVTEDTTYTAQYTAVKNQYTVSFDTQGKSNTPASISVSYGSTAAKPSTPTAIGYVFDGWYVSQNCTGDSFNFSSPITDNIVLYAKWNVATYTITWMDYDGRKLETTTVPHGDIPTPPEPPKRNADTERTYAFASWSPVVENAYEDKTYIATYTDSARTYTITWKDENGIVLDTNQVAFGETPSHDKPSDKEDGTNTYKFKEWSPEVIPVNGDRVYTATYKVIPKKYGVIFLNDEDELLYSTSCENGETPEYIGDTPVKEANAQYHYEFTGWSPAISPVAGENAVYKATFKEILNQYTIIWKGGDIESATVTADYGTPIKTPAEYTPKKAGDAQYSYVFTGWNPSVSTSSIVTHDVTYEPVFSKKLNQYTVTWKNEDDILEIDENVSYGKTPTYNGETPAKPPVSGHTYTFSGWSPAISPVTGDITYTAVFSDTPPAPTTYTIVWKNADGTVLKTDSNVGYGTIPQYNDTVPTKPADSHYTYTFSGWTPAVTAATSDAEYTASFTAHSINSGSSSADSSGYRVILPDDKTISASSSHANRGETVTIRVIAPNGMDLIGLTVTDSNGKTVDLTEKENETFVFTMPYSDVRVVPTYTIHVSSPDETGISNLLNVKDHIRYIHGYPDDTIRPNSNITRAETAMMFYRLLQEPSISRDSSYADVPENAWYGDAVLTLSDLGIINGYADGIFKPNAPISRAEFTTIAVRFAKENICDIHFPDVTPGYWAEGYISTAASYGWITGYEDKSFHPAASITRAEVSVIINRMLNRNADVNYVDQNKSVLMQFTDLQKPDAWYYYNMTEAANSHNCIKTVIEHWIP